MSYEIQDEGNGMSAVVWSGFEKGIAPSPHKGIGNMQAVDINTEEGEVMASYSRTLQTQNAATVTGGTVTQNSTNTVVFSTGGQPKIGTWITISGSGITGLANGNYYVLTSFKLSATFSRDVSTAVTGMGSGTATWSPQAAMGAAVQGATERYVNTSGSTKYRYYILDTNGRLWVKDTDFTTIGGETVNWIEPYNGSITLYNGSTLTTAGGMAIYNGYVVIIGGDKIFTIATARLGSTPTTFSGGNILSAPATTNPHYALAGKQGRLYYTDGPFVGSVFADISVDPSIVAAAITVPNIQSYCSYTTSSNTQGVISGVLNGSVPYVEGGTARVPAFFFPAFGGTQPTNLVAGTKYYIEYTPATYGNFTVYAALTGGSAINIVAGAVGQMYFNTFFPQSGSGNDTIVFTRERLVLPSFEIATTLAELGNTIVVGTQSNTLYPWDQINGLPSDQIQMPEANTAWMVTVNNVIYIGAGNRGNIYITNASSISLATSVPDYCSGLIEPYFVWGGAMFLRGRVYFSIKDETFTHTGNCGGVWSFIPVQNFTYGQDYGIAMRMDNQNSYANYNGKVNVFIPDQDQQQRGPQYFSAWNLNASESGIDASDTLALTPAVIETDIVPVGTLLNKKTFTQIEYKLAAPLDISASPVESVAFSYRTNLTSAFVSAGTMIVESTDNLSGYLPVNFEKVQWLQLKITLTPTTNTGASSQSFVRLCEVRAR